jgi:hypothetical protein
LLALAALAVTPKIEKTETSIAIQRRSERLFFINVYILSICYGF